MRIEQLEYLTAVIAHGSLRRASVQLHLSQPALSESVRKLERELGVELLERRRAGARVSRAGHDLLPLVEEVLAAVGRLRTAAGDRMVGGRVVRVGTVQAATSSLLVPATRTFGAAYPDIAVEVVTGRQSDLEDLVAQGVLDLALVNRLAEDDLPTGLAGQDLLRAPVVAVLPEGHHLAAGPADREIELDDVLAEPLVTMREGYLMHRLLGRLLRERDLLPPTSHAADGAEMGKVLVADGLGVTLLPRFSVAADPLVRAGALVWRPVRGLDDQVLLQARHRRDARMPAAARDLLDVLRAHAATLPDGRWDGMTEPPSVVRAVS